MTIKAREIHSQFNTKEKDGEGIRFFRIPAAEHMVHPQHHNEENVRISEPNGNEQNYKIKNDRRRPAHRKTDIYRN
jgi:hypothetical protein